MDATNSAGAPDLALLSECGPVRSENQDAGIAWRRDDDSALALIVADGMGGHAAGREAAEIAVRQIRSALASPVAGADWPERIAAGFGAAHREVLAGQREPGCQGMGTTAAVAVLDLAAKPARLHVAHAGDSRVYLLRGRSLYRLTTDHSLVAQMVRDGWIGEDEAAGHPDSNVVQRAIGQQAAFAPEIQPWSPLEAGDLVLVCSDGLHGSVPDENIRALALAAGNAAELCHALFAAAVDRQSPDNVTVGCCRLAAGARKRRPTRKP